MNTNLTNGPSANSSQAVIAGSKSSKQTTTWAQLFVTGQQPVGLSLTKDPSTATFQEALDKTLTVLAGESQEIPWVTSWKKWASTQAQSLARTRKSISTMRSLEGTVQRQTSLQNQDRPSATTAWEDTAKTSRTRRSPGLSTPARSQAQTSNGPVKTDKKDQASLQQEGTESQGTDPGQQGGQPVACPDTSIAISSGVVTDDPITDQEGSKANPMVKTAIGTKAQEGAIALKASMDQMDTVSGKSEGESDGSSKTTELLLATSTTQTGGSPAAVSGQVLSRVTHTPSTTDEGTGQPKDSSVGLRLETTSQQQGGAGDPALNMTSMVSVELSKDQGQGVPQKDPVRVAKHDGASTVQTQIWPNAGLVVESLTDLGGPISGQIDDSVMQQLVEKNRLSLHGQVVSSIRGALETQTHRLSVELNPPELGKVLIRFEQQEGRLTGLLEVDNRATAADIKQALPQIIQNLQDSGIQIKHLDVMLNDQNQRSSRDSALADMYQGRSGQQDQGRPWSSADQAVYPNSTPDTAAVSPESARPQVSIGTDGSINLLM